MCLKIKTWAGKSHDRQVIVFEKLRLQNVFCPHEIEKSAFSNSSGLKRVFENLRFCDRSAWTVDLSIETELHFSISSA